MQETQVQSLGGEDLLEKEMATHSSTLAWKIPWEKPGRLQSMGLQRVGHNLATLLTSIYKKVLLIIIYKLTHFKVILREQKFFQK